MTFKQRLISFWNKIQKYILPFLSCVLLTFTCAVSSFADSPSDPDPEITDIVSSLSCVCENGTLFTGDDVGDVSLGIYGGLLCSHEIVLNSVSAPTYNRITNEDVFTVVYRLRGVSLQGSVLTCIEIPYESLMGSTVLSMKYKLGNGREKNLDFELSTKTASQQTFYGTAVSSLGPRPSEADYDVISQPVIRFEVPLDSSSDLTITLVLKSATLGHFFRWPVLNDAMFWYLYQLYDLEWVSAIITLFAASACFIIFVKFMR